MILFSFFTGPFFPLLTVKEMLEISHYQNFSKKKRFIGQLYTSFATIFYDALQTDGRMEGWIEGKAEGQKMLTKDSRSLKTSNAGLQ